MRLGRSVCLVLERSRIIPHELCRADDKKIAPESIGLLPGIFRRLLSDKEER